VVDEHRVDIGRPGNSTDRRAGPTVTSELFARSREDARRQHTAIVARTPGVHGVGRRAEPGQAERDRSAIELTWDSARRPSALDVVGDIELRLVASATAMDTAWMVTLQDVASDGTVTDVTAGWLRASLREVDEAASRPGAPVLRCRSAQAVPIGEDVEYRIPLVSNARRFKAGHRVRLVLTSNDQDPSTPAIMNFRHASVGTSSLNTIRSSSCLLPSVIP
jgi:predicted acyl esterase